MTKLTVIARSGFNGCAGGQCPTLYRSEDGRLFVQGYFAAADVKAAANLPAGEDLVEISPELLADIKRA